MAAAITEPTEEEEFDIETSFLTFAEETLGLNLYPWQEDAIEPFDEASEKLVQVTLATPNGSGKSAVVIATLVLGWLALYPKGKVVLTTADGKQLDGQVMPALESHRPKFPAWEFLSRKINTPTGGQFVAFTTDQAGRAEGWHKIDDIEGPLLIICDEAKSVPEPIFQALDRCTYNGILLASSPGRLSGTFYETHHNPALGYIQVKVGLKDCPHIGQDKIDRIIAKHGPNSPFTRSTLHGEFLASWDGKPVYYAFNRDLHESEDRLPWPKGAFLVRGYDFGTNNSTIFSAYFKVGDDEYWWDLEECFMESSDTDRQAKMAVHITNEIFPFWNDREMCAGVMDFIDPAGNNRAFTRKINVNGAKVDDSPINILRTYGINPGFTYQGRGLQETIAIVNRLLDKRDRNGKPSYRIDVQGCPRLTDALRGEYRYSAPGEPGYEIGKDEPLKGPICNHADGLSDAARYAKIAIFRMMRSEIAVDISPGAHMQRVKNPNPVRKWR